MNIFFFDRDPEICAHQHCDKHVVKMIVEYAQLLSTAHRVLDGTESIQKSLTGRNQKVFTLQDTDFDSHLYKATHINHPSAKWVRHCEYNYEWLVDMFWFLLREYTARYGKIHKCDSLAEYLQYPPISIPETEFSTPWRAMPDEYKVDKSGNDKYCEQSYQAYFNNTKQHIAKWKHNDIPAWFIPKETTT
jgi:hypothetical protein